MIGARVGWATRAWETRMIGRTARLSREVARRPVARLAVLRTRVFEISILLWSGLFGVAILTYFQIVRRPAEVRWLLRRWSIGFVWAARWIVGVRYRLDGVDNIPDGPVIYVCNHQSYWESVAFTALVPHLNVITKAEAMEIPVFGWGLRHAPMIAIYRDRKGTNLRRMVREAKASLAEGRSILLFPEGTRVAPGERKAYQRGLELVYRACNATVVPVVQNAGHCWAEGFQTKRAGEVTVRFLPAIAPGGDGAATAARLEDMINREKDLLPGPALAHE